MGSGGKKTVKRYLKSEHTDKHTDTRTDRQTDGHLDLQKASAQRADALQIIAIWDAQLDIAVIFFQILQFKILYNLSLIFN